MAVSKGIKRLLHSKKGDAAIEFIMVTAMLILVFSVLVTALVYVTQVYNASYITRRVVRSIETAGEYNEHTVQSLVDELGGDALSGVKLKVEASYYKGKKIQLRDGIRCASSSSGRRPSPSTCPFRSGLRGDRRCTGSEEAAQK